MKPFFPPRLLLRMGVMESIGSMTLTDRAKQLPDELRETAQSTIGDLAQECALLGLQASRITAERISLLLTKNDSMIEEFRLLIVELHGRIIDEMAAPRFFVLSAEEAEYYNNYTKGWESAIARFPDSMRDIEEARKCYGLARYAAAVFHTLQVVEIGLIELGTFLKVADPKSGWTAVTGALNRVVKKDPRTWTRFEKKNFKFLEQVQAAAESMKNAWRNKISHAQGRLVLMSTDFVPEIAEEILFSARSFMRRLSDGLPPARGNS